MVVQQQEPASFRDPANRVFYHDGQVRRGLRGPAVDDWRALAATRFFARMVDQGSICATEELAAGADPSPDGGQFDLVLRHERIPYVSYPYEWTFAMLRDAALLHLDLLSAAVPEGMITKDGTAYNLQWRGAQPTFIDTGSFERLRAGEPWAGYRQFCQTMLYPLLLQAHLGVDFQPWLRARIDGIEPDQMRRLFGGGRRWKPGVFKHVHLHDALQRRMAGASAGEVRADLRAAGFSTELVLATLRSLRKLVQRLEWQPPASHWGGYRQTCSYSDADAAAKRTFVDSVLAEAAGPGGGLKLVLDLGANDGAYARVAAGHAEQVVAVESDHPVADDLYRRLRDEGERRILPLVMDLADPSPGGGWRGTERAPFLGRADAGAVLALALVHHLAIGRNVPLPEVLDWLAGLGRLVVVEFVDPADPMASRLLANKPAGMFSDYRLEVFERLVEERFTVRRREALPSGTRTLFAGIPRG
jgi:SAM-dependent methyltransferase